MREEEPGRLKAVVTGAVMPAHRGGGKAWWAREFYRRSRTVWGSKWKLLEVIAIFLAFISQVSNMWGLGSGFKLCHCYSIKNWFLLVLGQRFPKAAKHKVAGKG